MPSEASNLYSLLGVGRDASTSQLREAYEWTLSTGTSETREAARRAYAVLGDPRLREQYDRGEMVGVGAGMYYQTGGPDLLAGKAAYRQTPSSSRSGSAQSRVRGNLSVSLPWRAALVIVLALGAAYGGKLAWKGDQAPGPGGLSTEASARLSGSRDVSSNTANLGPARSAPSLHLPSGACFLLNAEGRLIPSQPRDCRKPHQVEVIKTVDLIALEGKPLSSPQETSEIAASVCGGEFTAFTGLAGPTTDMWPTHLTNTGPGIATVTCTVQSRYPRNATARDVAR